MTKNYTEENKQEKTTTLIILAAIKVTLLLSAWNVKENSELTSSRDSNTSFENQFTFYWKPCMVSFFKNNFTKKIIKQYIP